MYKEGDKAKTLSKVNQSKVRKSCKVSSKTSLQFVTFSTTVRENLISFVPYLSLCCHLIKTIKLIFWDVLLGSYQWVGNAFQAEVDGALKAMEITNG
jgi:hypothetical protein